MSGALSSRLAEAVDQGVRPKSAKLAEVKVGAISSRHDSGGFDSGVADVGESTSVRHSELRAELHAKVLEKLGVELGSNAVSEDELEGMVRSTLTELLGKAETPLTATQRSALMQSITAEVLALGPLEPLLDDESVTEIMVNGPSTIYVERGGRLEQTDTAFSSEAHLRRIIDRIVSRVGRRVDESSPTVDARLPDGSRVNATVPPVSVDGPTLTIRKFSKTAFNVEDLISFGTLTIDAAQFLQAAVESRLNIVVSGGTGGGKTTLLNVLSAFIPASDRIVTIEDSAELRLTQDHVVRMEARPASVEGTGEVTIRDLVKNSLRMRPDHIIVGEVRDGAAFDFLQAMNTGHDGSMGTVHANSTRDALSRLETLTLMAGLDLPQRAIREQIASAVDIVIQQSKLRDGSRRIVAISEITGMEADRISMQDIFIADSQGKLTPAGIIPNCLTRLQDAGAHVDRGMFATDDFSRSVLRGN
jgi:pilus assembly protein CpaF